jgi:hypothetical protein
MAGDEGFEPPMTGPEPVALPLGQSPIVIDRRDYTLVRAFLLELKGLSCGEQ